MFLAATPSGSQGCFLFIVPGPSLEKHSEAGTVHRAEAVLPWAPEVIRSSADESEAPVRAASYPVPAGDREDNSNYVMGCWRAKRPKAMGLLSLVVLYRSLPQWHPGGQHTLPAFCLPTPAP